MEELLSEGQPLYFTLLYLGLGRIAGISGIAEGVVTIGRGLQSWRLAFTGGLFCGGLVLKFFKPDSFQGELQMPIGYVLIAGLLVGFGTRLGGGCTSGHGVCGVSRFSVRSVCATLTFISSGIFTVFALRQLGWVL